MRYLLLLALAVMTLAPPASAKDRWRNGRSNGNYGYNNGYGYGNYGSYRNMPPGIAKKGGWLPPGQARRMDRGSGYGWDNRDYRDYSRYGQSRDWNRYDRNRYSRDRYYGDQYNNRYGDWYWQRLR